MRITFLRVSCALPAMAIAGLPDAANAQAVLLDYADLSSLEEPLAVQMGQATVVVSGVVDGRVRIDLDESVLSEAFDPGLVTNYQVAVETQLGNRWTIGATYSGQYDTYSDQYTDNVAGYVRTSWGTLVGGNVGGLVREDTRRRRAPGNAVLAYDDFLGQNARWGGLFRVTNGPFVSSFMVDEDGGVEAGTVYQRPYGRHDIRWSVRGRRGQIRAANGDRRFRTAGVNAVADLTYGSSIYDLGIGYERITGQGLELDRWFLSTGARTKIYGLSLSAEGHVGTIDGSPEYSAAAGLSYALSRGLSANLGFNYREADVERSGITVLQGDEKSTSASIRYSF